MTNCIDKSLVGAMTQLEVDTLEHRSLRKEFLHYSTRKE